MWARGPAYKLATSVLLQVVWGGGRDIGVDQPYRHICGQPADKKGLFDRGELGVVQYKWCPILIWRVLTTADHRYGVCGAIQTKYLCRLVLLGVRTGLGFREEIVHIKSLGNRIFDG